MIAIPLAAWFCQNAAAMNGTCGTAMSGSAKFVNPPTSGLCATGSAGAITNSNTWIWSWSCAGSGGGTTQFCYAPKITAGSCGAASGSVLTSKPAANLCSVGSAGAVSGSGPWTWGCTGLNGGASAACSASSAASSHLTTISDSPSGLCLDSSGAAPVFAACAAGSAQTYLVTATADGYYKIQTQGASSGLCLDFGNADSQGLPVLAKPCSSAASQKWVISPAYNANFIISSVGAGGCLDTKAQSLAAATPLVTTNCYFNKYTQFFALPGFTLPAGAVPASLPAPQAGTGLSAIAGFTLGYDGYLGGDAKSAALMQLFGSEGITRQRIGNVLYPLSPYTQYNTVQDPVILNAAHAASRPIFIADWYAPQEGSTIPPASVWYAAGQFLANRYRPNSAWLISQGITNWGVTTYEAFNEPDLHTIPLNQYHDAMQAYAGGIHSVDPSLNVVSGAFGSCDAFGDITVRGFAGAIRDLYNNGTLSGMDLHMYYGIQWVPIENGSHGHSVQYCFDAIKQSAGITADLDFYATEFQYARGGQHGLISEMTEDYAAQGFLAVLWDNFGVVRRDGKTPAAKLADPWNMTMTVQQSQPPYSMAVQLSPYVANLRGSTYAMLMRLTSGLSFDPTSAHMDPRGKGEWAMAGGGRTLYVWQNWYGWTNHLGSTYTVDIPPGRTHLDVYGWDGRRASYAVAGQTQYVVTGLRRNETHMFLVY